MEKMTITKTLVEDFNSRLKEFGTEKQFEEKVKFNNFPENINLENINSYINNDEWNKFLNIVDFYYPALLNRYFPNIPCEDYKKFAEVK